MLNICLHLFKNVIFFVYIYLIINLFFMKKITFLFFNILSFCCYSQISVSENFDDPDIAYDIPDGWTTDDAWFGYLTYVSDSFSCSGDQAFNANLYEESPYGVIETPNYQGTLTTALNVSYNLLILDYYEETPVDYNFGNIELLYSTDNGGSWISLGSKNSSNFTSTSSCQTVSYTINQGVLNSGGTIKFKFDMEWNEGDFIFFIDDFVINQSATASVSDLNKDNLRLYPNPTSEILNISYTDEITSVKVFDLFGRKILTQTPNTSKFTLSTTMLSSGTYLLGLETKSGEKSVVKFIKI